jgi:hypothetical protein
MSLKESKSMSQILEGLLVFLRLKQFDYVENILKENGICVDAENHSLLKSFGAGWYGQDTEALLWILEKGNYSKRYPEIALCIYSQCNANEEVKNLLKQGLNPKKAPWSNSEDPIGFALRGDADKCLKELVDHLPKEDLTKDLESLLLASSEKRAQNCTITVTQKIKKPTPNAEIAWYLWQTKDNYPENVALSIAKILPTLNIERILKRSKKINVKGTKNVNKERYASLLNKELKTRVFKEKISSSKSFEIES